MNRRFLIALAVVVPLINFIQAKAAVSWRPIIIGKVKGADTVYQVTSRYLLVHGDYAGTTLFDLKTGARRILEEDSEGLANLGAWKWKLIFGRTVQLQLREANGAARLYACPHFEVAGMKPLAPDWIRISPQNNRLEMLLMNRYYRWDLRSRHLTQNVPLIFFDGAIEAASFRSNVLVKEGAGGIDFVSMNSGQRVRHVALRARNDFCADQLAPGALYTICDNNNGFGPATRNLVADTQTGRVLWQFALDDWRDCAAFSPDAKRIAIPQTNHHRWQIHNSKTGVLLHTLPLISGVHTAVFSPDGATLYSVANGVLYRQRAR